MHKSFWIGLSMLLVGVIFGLGLSASTIESVNVGGDHRDCIKENR